MTEREAQSNSLLRINSLLIRAHLTFAFAGPYNTDFFSLFLRRSSIIGVLLALRGGDSCRELHGMFDAGKVHFEEGFPGRSANSKRLTVD